MASSKDDLKYEVINSIGIISTTASGWNLELNRVSWNGKEPKYDLRSWSPDHKKMGKGVTLSEEELISLDTLLIKEIDFLKND